MVVVTHRIESSELAAGDHIYTWKTFFAYSHHGKVLFDRFLGIIWMANYYVRAAPTTDLNRNTEWFTYPGVWTIYIFILFFSWLVVLSLWMLIWHGLDNRQSLSFPCAVDGTGQWVSCGRDGFGGCEDGSGRVDDMGRSTWYGVGDVGYDVDGGLGL
ncbi:hypothetical protein RND71_004573 [Anisodus tanguticus]|uniref:Uncharacterized protein n=1 Tax=Anisodus tanguticus TaxID=243964 RepID=A0AAE1SSG8_9SOLA|nr:hypothetical protein RND71_004573 [Anisodus tanguticus]